MFYLDNDAVQKDDIYIVAIGASAGGLEAINELFDSISDSDHFAFIVVQHLSSDYKSLLVELIGKHTHMFVEEARNNQRIEAGRVYVIPNNKELTVENGILILDEKEFDKGPNTTIDILFQSVAEDQREFAVGVLLSGTGTDGTKGIEYIKRNGGFVTVQDPRSAKFDGMPRSAIASGYADLILTPGAMFNQIDNYVDGLLQNKITKSKKHNDCVKSILGTVYKKTGYDFMQYKQPTILRRIARRMHLVKAETISDYEKYVKGSDEECDLLSKEFFIGVTNFFRDKDAFESLYNDVIVKLVEQKEEYDSLKVWITACSTGQEAYSLAILIDQALQQVNKSLDIKIFATDIDKSSIEFAAKGKYQSNQLLGLDKKVFQAYFTPVEDGICIVPRIRKQIVFATHDILKDPPFIKNDLVTCRNFLIYLSPSLQENVLATLHFSLNHRGFLFLGTSENPSLLRKGFSEVNSKWKIYQRVTDNNSYTKRNAPVTRSQVSAPAFTPTSKSRTDIQLADDFKKVLVDKLGYAGLYVNENYEIKEGVGDFKKYLSLPDKLSTLNILKMAMPELSGVLSTLLRKCQKEDANQSLRNIKIKSGDQTRILDLFIYPPRETSGSIYTLIVFAEALVDKLPVSIEASNLFQKDQYVQQLEEDLRETKTNLQMAVESLETANEELQSSNEELQSANEELQSSNEELQSLNEELHTLNTEHQIRIRELVELNDDITNYLQTSLIGQIFLDNKLQIRRFNRAASVVINIIESDIGRPIDHITQHIRSSTFLDDINNVNRTGEPVEREIELNDGAVYFMRILPYLRQDKKRDGIVITLVDVSTTKNLNSMVKGVFDASINPIFVFDVLRSKDRNSADYVLKIANLAAYQAFGMEVQQSGLTLKKDFPELATSALLKKYNEEIGSDHPAVMEINFIRNDRKFWFQAGFTKLRDGFILVLTDVTQRKVAEEKLRKNYNELLVTKETLRDLNNQLEIKVKDRTRDLSVSEERFRLVASLTNDVIWDWHFASNQIWWSDSYYEIFGFSKEDPDVHKHSFRLQHIHPEDRDKVQKAFDQVLEGNEKEFKISYRFAKSNGQYAHVLERGTLLIEEFGMPYRMIGSMVDVTKLEQVNQQISEKNEELQSLIQEFRFVTDFMPQMVWSTQPDGYHDFFNQKWYEYTGLDYDQSKDGGWKKIIHPNDVDRASQAWKNSVKSGSPYEIEYRIKKHDGIYRWFLVRALPMEDEQGKVLKWFGTSTDIDDQKMAEKLLEDKIEKRTSELRLLNKKLETSNVNLLQFAAVASHDLKEPLRKIHFFSGLLKEKFPQNTSDHIYAYIERILKASWRATNLINDVLSYSQLSSETLFEKVDLNKIVHDILQDFELVIEEKQAVINLDKLPVVTAVPGQMRQLFQNIINNAIKFHKSGHPPVIHISCDVADKIEHPELNGTHGKYFEITIKDEGIGFDNQYAEKIFALFQRLNGRESYEGTGIGLAIANKIVERHNGIIIADGKENEGAVFIILLPEEQPKYFYSSSEIAN